MEKRSVFTNKLLPYALLAPQLAVTLVFFYWPASQAVWTSFMLEDAFGTLFSASGRTGRVHFRSLHPLVRGE